MSDHPRPGPAERINLGEPSTPRPAASVILLRRGSGHKRGRCDPAEAGQAAEPPQVIHSDRALEVLMLKRSENAPFMPGVWVFPGGAVDPEDGEGEAGFRACAVRELAEEAGIELDPEEELVLFTRWITPEVVSTRFDAWFFLALAPAHSPPQPDGVETTEAGWFEPRAALDANVAGELALAFPTVKQLERLLPFATSEDAIEAGRGLAVEPILPKVVADPESGHRVVLPGEEGYE